MDRSKDNTRDVALPRSLARAGLVATDSPAEPPFPQPFRVLVVDDQADHREILTFTLENAALPFSVTTAVNGREALALAQAELPHLILLDVLMPDIDGFEVCNLLRADLRTAFIPVILLTALTDDAALVQAGTDDYIRKPFTASELLAHVERILKRTHGSQLRRAPHRTARPGAGTGSCANPGSHERSPAGGGLR